MYALLSEKEDAMETPDTDNLAPDKTKSEDATNVSHDSSSGGKKGKPKKETSQSKGDDSDIIGPPLPAALSQHNDEDEEMIGPPMPVSSRIDSDNDDDDDDDSEEEEEEVGYVMYSKFKKWPL